MTDSFSIVIPTYLRAALLTRTLPSYLMTGAKQVIVVDDASSNAHRGDLLRLASDPRVHLVILPRHVGLPAARNEGVTLAQTDWSVFGEEDV